MDQTWKIVKTLWIPLINGIHNSSLFSRSDPFFSRLNGGSSLFDDLIDGAQTGNNDGRRSNHTTTFTTGNGNTIHITRTVIGGDGSVRREMRFRTPAAPSNAEPNPRPTARVQPTSRPPPPNNTSNRYIFILLLVCFDKAYKSLQNSTIVFYWDAIEFLNRFDFTRYRGNFFVSLFLVGNVYKGMFALRT